MALGFLKPKTKYLQNVSPEQNVKVERDFSFLYNRVRAMLNYAGIFGSLRKFLWAECANTATLLDNIHTSDAYIDGTKRSPHIPDVSSVGNAVQKSKPIHNMV